MQTTIVTLQDGTQLITYGNTGVTETVKPAGCAKSAADFFIAPEFYWPVFRALCDAGAFFTTTPEGWKLPPDALCAFYVSR